MNDVITSSLFTYTLHAVILGVVYFYLLSLRENCKKDEWYNYKTFVKYILFFISIHYIGELMSISRVTITTLFLTKIIFVFIEYCDKPQEEVMLSVQSETSCDTGICSI